MSISFTPSQTLAIIEAVTLCNCPWNDGFSPEAHTQAIVVSRALGRFEREFGWYTESKGPVSVVREYHRELVDEVKLFIKLRR